MALVGNQRLEKAITSGAPGLSILASSLNTAAGETRYSIEAVQLMPVGSKYRVVIPSELAYGEQGAPPVIEPNSVLVFEIELLGIEEEAAEQLSSSISKAVPMTIHIGVSDR